MSKKPNKGKEQEAIDPYGDLKIADARGLLEQMQRETSDIITKIRSHSNQVENQRRILEEKMRQERNKKIHTEVITSHKKNVEIDWTW